MACPQPWLPLGSRGGVEAAASRAHVRRSVLGPVGADVRRQHPDDEPRRALLEADAKSDNHIAYHTQTPTFQELPRWLERTINHEIRKVRFTEKNLDQKLVSKLIRTTRVEKLGLLKARDDGEIEKAEKENPFQTFGIPAGCMLLLFMIG